MIIYIDVNFKETLKECINKKDWYKLKKYSLKKCHEICGNVDAYINDLKIRKNKEINKFIDNFNLSNFDFNINDIKKVVLCGKNFDNSQYLKNIHKNIPNCQKNKADIFIILNSSEILFGLSIKQDSKCTKFNRSLYLSLNCSKSVNKLKDIKIKFIKNNYPELSNLNNKNYRKKINKLMYNKYNPFWTNIREVINNKHNIIKTDLKSILYGEKLPYYLYEYNSESIKKIENTLSLDNITFREYEEFYLTKNGNPRKAAKLFYLFETPTDNYRVEIRHKGSYSASPQFQFHKI